jgi:hypothetical protein
MTAGTSIKGADGIVTVTLSEETELKMSPETARTFARALLRQAAKAEGVTSGAILTMEVPE